LPQSAEDHSSPTFPEPFVSTVPEGAVKLSETAYSALFPPSVLTETPLPVATSVPEVNSLLRQYAQMRKMFKSMGKPSFARRLAGMKMPGM